ncbi:MAG: ATP-binding cassette domain-containing protein [Alphaproteobacteria bacterium]|nr:MAG: ATP-binding cassette domain-containing protein [Alphaproteobacteria bacterium]
MEHWFWKYAFENKNVYIQAGIATLLVNLFALVIGFFVMVVYDRIIPSNALTSLVGLFVGASVIILLRYALELLKTYFLDYAGQTIERKTSESVFDKIMRYDLLRAPKSNGSVAALVKDFETFQQFFTSVTILLLIDIPFMFLFLYVIYAIGGPLVYVPLIIIPLVAFVGLVIQPFLKKMAKSSLDGGEAKQTVLLETLQNIETVKSISGADKLRKRWLQAVDKQADVNVKTKFYNQIATSFSSSALMFNQIMIVSYGVLLIGDGALSMGGLIGAMIISGRALAPVGQISQVLGRLNVSMECYRRIDEFMNVTNREEIANEYVKRSELKGPISTKNLTFRYPESQVKLFDNLTLEIKEGEKVAVLGKIGSGKSSLVRILLGLYLADDGLVMVGGTNVNQIRPEDMRKNFGVVHQNVSLFSGTVRDNITLGVDEFDDDLLVKVSEISGVMDWLGKLPNGFDYKLSEGGKELSGGQKQTVALARALMRKPHYLLFDEPTANMDTGTEQQVLMGLKKHLSDETVLIVTHRMAPLSLVDRIIVLDSGRVAVDGPKDLVIQKLQAKQTA